MTSTGLRLTLEAVQSKEQYDRYAKTILSFKVLLAWILKTCTDEFREYSIAFIEQNCIEGTPVIGVNAVHQNQPDKADDAIVEASRRIEGLDTENSSAEEERNTFDIRFSATVPGDIVPVELMINIEFQKRSYNLGYPLPKRGIYYCARMLSRQYGTVFVRSDYGSLQKVYSIWICPNVEEVDADTIVSYQIKPSVRHGAANPQKADYDLLDTTVISLTQDFRNSGSKIIRLLGTIFMPLVSLAEKEKTLEDEFGIPMTEDLKEALDDMCNLSDGILEFGINKGLLEGDRLRLEEDARGMYAEGLKPDVIARIQKVSVDVIEGILGVQHTPC